MASIDERVVAMSFENSKFEANVATTMTTLGKLDTAIANIGRVNGLASIEASANKVTLIGPMTALDKLNQKLASTNAGTTFSDMEKASGGVTLNPPMTALDKLKQKLGLTNAGTTFSDMEKAADRVSFSAPISALDKLKQKLGFTNAGTTFTDIERASDKVTFTGAMTASDKLQSKINGISSGKTFTDMEAASSRISFSSLTQAIDGIGSHFSTMSVAVGTAIGGLAAQVTQKAGAMIKSIALDPVIQGFQEYQTNLGSIQTILANTQDSGGNLKTVQGALQNLNRYSDKTIYNFGQMAQNIGTFTAAGVRLKPATEAIKGIANLAALSGSNSQQASTAMYQLSQAIAAGHVSLQDWNSVVNAGMGGAVFQKALLRTGENMGTIAKGALNIDKATGKATVNGKSFRESITAKPGEQSWLTSDVLTKTLSQFTGDLSDAKLAAEGFDAEQIKAIQQTAKTAQAAATQVKSLPQVFDVAKETIGSGWSQTFQTIFGNFTEAKKTFTELSQTINGFINTNSNARNKVLAAWKELGGRTDLIAGIKNAFTALKDILKPIQDAFREIFPRQTGKDLADLTKNFRELMKHLQASPKTMENIKRTFEGFFAVLHIGWTIVKTVVHFIGQLLGASKNAAGGVLQLTGNVGEFLKKLDEAVSKKGVFEGLFGGLKNAVKNPLDLIKKLAEAIRNLFAGGDATGSAGKFSGAMATLHKALGPLGGILDVAIKAWDGFLNILDKVKTAISPLLENIAHTVSNFGNLVADGIKNANYDKVFTAIQTTLIAGIFVAIKKAIGGGVGVNIDVGAGLLKNLSGTFGALTNNLKEMQRSIQAHTLLAIATAIGILAFGVAQLAKIDPKKLTAAMIAVAIGMGELVAAMVILSTATTVAGSGKILAISASLTVLSTAVVSLAAAVKIFATMSWDELIRGLAGVAGALTAVGVATQVMNGPKILVTAAALLPMAIGLNVLALAVKIFATMSWEQMGKGLVGVAGALTAIGVALHVMPPGLILTGAGLIAISAGLVILAGAVAAFGFMNLETLSKGILAIGGAIAIIGIAIEAFPPSLGLQAAALILIGAGLTSLSVAIGILGSMNILTLVKGIIAMGGALAVLSIGLDAMSGTIPGSVALLAAAAAFAILAPTIGLLGVMPWGVVLKSLAVMAVTLGILAIAGGLAAVPLIALGAAILALGIGLLAVGGAVYVFAKAISLLSGTSTKAIAALIAAISVFIAAFPNMVINFVKGVVTILGAAAELAPKIVASLVTIAGQLLDAIIKLAPKIAEAVGALITAIVTVLSNNSGPILAAGAKVFLLLLSGIGQNIGKVTDKVVTIVTHFVDALVRNAPKLIASGARVLISFLTGITNHLPQIVTTVAKLIATFLNSVARNIGKVITAGGNLIFKFITAVANQVPKIVIAGTNIIIGFIRGVGNAGPRILRAAVEAGTKFINALANALVRLVNVGFNAIINFLNGIARAIRKNNDALWNAGWNVANAIIDGLLSGLTNLAGKVISKAGELISKIPGKFLDVLGIGSPSKVMIEIGKFTMLGLHKGLVDNANLPIRQSEEVAKGLIGQFKKTLGISSPSKVMEELGKEVNRGFAKGLTGSGSDIQTAFSNLDTKLKDAITTARETIATEQTRLDAELKKKHPDLSVVNDARKVIAENEAVLAKSVAAHDALTHRLVNQKIALVSLSREYDRISAKLDKANQVLDDAKKKRDDAQASLTTEFSTTPDINKDSTSMVGDYTKALLDQIAATASYAETLKQLRALGLDDKTYQKLLDEGLSGKKFAEQLLAGGKAGVDNINALDAQLQGVATTLAHTAATQLYQAGVDAAKGIVDGLTNQKQALHNSMIDLANVLVSSIKKKLKIRSPSGVFAEIGRLSIQGLTKAMDDSTGMVEDSASRVGESAAVAIRKSMSGIAFEDIGDIEPVITPVLDLTNVKKDASTLADLMPVPVIAAAVSTDQAASISDQQSALAAVTAVQAPSTTVSFEQNNYSPDPLSNIEIYRQTNNQLSRVKSLVGAT